MTLYIIFFVVCALPKTSNGRPSMEDLNIDLVTVNISEVLRENLNSETRQRIFNEYESFPSTTKIPLLNLTSNTLKSLNLQYESYIREWAPILVLFPKIPLENAQIFLSFIPSDQVGTTIKELPSDKEPWNTLPGKFVILQNIIRRLYRPVALWESNQMTYYSMYLDGLSQKQLQLFEYELPLRRLNEMANDLSALHTKYGNEASCHSLVRNMNENARRLKDITLGETSAKLLLSCASHADLLLQDNNLYSLTQGTEISTASTARSILNQLIPYIAGTTKPVPLSLISGLDAMSVQQIASANMFQSNFVGAVLKRSDFEVLQLTEHYIAMFDGSNTILRLLMSPYTHVSQLKDFQLNIRLFCSQIGKVNVNILSSGQKSILFGYYKSYCHASNGVINFNSLSRNQLSLCMFDSAELNELSTEDLNDLRDFILTDCPCLSRLQKFVIFSKIEKDLIDREYFQKLLSCFESFLTKDLARSLVEKQISPSNFCSAKLPADLLQSVTISKVYMHNFDFEICTDSQKIELLQTLKYSDFGVLRPKVPSYRLDYMHVVSKLETERSVHQQMALELSQTSVDDAITELQAFSLTGKTTVEFPVSVISKSKFCSEAIFAIGMENHKNVPSSVLETWVETYFDCQPDKFVLATRKDVDLLGHLACYIPPSWVKTMTAYTFKVYLSRISNCTLNLKLGKVIQEMILKHEFFDTFTISSIAPLYCYIDPELNNTDVLLPNTFYSTAANAMYNRSPVRIFEFSQKEKSLLFKCAEQLSSNPANHKSSVFSLATLTCHSRISNQQISCWHFLKFQKSRLEYLKDMSSCEIQKCLRHMDPSLWSSSEMLKVLSDYLSTIESSASEKMHILRDSGKSLEVLDQHDFESLIKLVGNSGTVFSNLDFVSFLSELNLSHPVLAVITNYTYYNLLATPSSDARSTFIMKTLERRLQKITLKDNEKVNFCDRINLMDSTELEHFVLTRGDEMGENDIACVGTENWKVLSNSLPETTEKVIRKLYGIHSVPEHQWQQVGLYHLMKNETSPHRPTDFENVGDSDSEEGSIYDSGFKQDVGNMEQQTMLIYVYASSFKPSANFYILFLYFSCYRLIYM